MIVLALGAALALVAGAGLASLGRPRGVVEAALGTLVAAAAVVIVVSFALSLLSAYTRWWLVASLAVVALASAAAARRRGSLPRPTSGPWLDVARDPVVVTLAVTVALELAYVLALALFTPQNDGDAIHYHLTRPALWRQEHAIGLIDGTRDTRMNAFPPHAEVLVGATMLLSATARYVGLVQLVALLTAVTAVLGIGRRIGVERRTAVTAALLFATLPIVALQASTALNDIVVGALAACSAFFLLRPTRHDLVLAGAATALLLGTKVTGILALPGLLAVAAVAQRGRNRAGALAAVVAGAAAGSYWYAWNLARTGDAFGGFADEQRGGHDPVAWLGRFTRLAVDAVELPGGVGRDRLLYVLAAAAVLVVGMALARTRAGRLLTLAAAALTLLPLALPPLERGLLRVHQKGWNVLGREDVGNLDPGRDITKAGTLSTWYGPVGLLLVAVCLVVVVHRARRHRLPPVAIALAAAPVVWLAAIAVGVAYFEWNGRFAMGGVALAAGTWGVVLERRAVAWAAVAVAAVTVLLTLVHYDEKPSGLRLLEDTGRESVWTMPRWQVQGIVESLGPLIRGMDRHVPDGALVAVFPSPFPEDEGARGVQLLPYPLFGPALQRRLVYAADIDAAERSGATWAVLPDDALTGCRDGWRVAFHAEPRWVVLERDPTAECAGGDS